MGRQVMRRSAKGLFFVVVFAVAIYGSTLMWAEFNQQTKPAPYELVDLKIEDDIRPGATVRFVYNIIKREDCPGIFTVRILGPSGNYFTVDEGRLGENEASPEPYLFPKLLRIPEEVMPGKATVSLVVSLICDDGRGHVVRFRKPVESPPGG